MPAFLETAAQPTSGIFVDDFLDLFEFSVGQPTILPDKKRPRSPSNISFSSKHPVALTDRTTIDTLFSMKVPELQQITKLLKAPYKKKKEHLVDLIIKHADPEFLEPYIATARQKFDEKNKKNLAEINRTRLQEWRQKKRKHDSQSVHVNRVLGQQKRRARETDKKVTIQAQLMECLKRHDPNDPIHNQPMAEHNMRAFDKEKSLLKVNIWALGKGILVHYELCRL